MVSIVQRPIPVGARAPPHKHTLEDEYSIVTEGEIGFRSGDREVGRPGGYITKPRGELHTMWNAGPFTRAHDRGDQPGRVRALLLERQRGGGRGPARPRGDPALAAEHGLEMGDAPWLDDVVERYHLTHPFGRE